jgi:hypothetical protein
MANEKKRPSASEGEPDEPYIHPESLGRPGHLEADLEDVIDLFTHDGTESDEPDIEADSPAP